MDPQAEPEVEARPMTAQTDMSSASRMSEKRRERLQKMLDKEELKDAIFTRLQVEMPNMPKDVNLMLAAEREAEKLVQSGLSRPGTPAASLPESPAQADSVKSGSRPGSRPGTASSVRSHLSNVSNRLFGGRPGTASKRLTKSVGDIVRPKSAIGFMVADAADNVVSHVSRGNVVANRSSNVGSMQGEDYYPQPPSVNSEDQLSQKSQSSSGEHVAPSGPTIDVPFFTVAGRQTQLAELVYDKIAQSVRLGGDTRIMFKRIDKLNTGKIDAYQLQRFLAEQNVEMGIAEVRQIIQLYDSTNEGTINFNDFRKKMLPPDYPDNKSKFTRASAVEEGEDDAVADSVSTQEDLPPMGFEKLQHLLREKLQQRTKSGNPVREAFRHFEKNADMEITEDGLRKVLHGFNIRVHPADLEDMMERYDRAGRGAIGYYDFIEGIIGTDYPMVGKRDHALIALRHIKERVNRKTETLARAFRRFDIDANGVLDINELRELCYFENIDVDEDTLDSIMRHSTHPDGSLTRDDFERAVEESDQLFDELQAKRPDKNYGLGFGQPKKPRARNPEAENLAIPKIEALLQEKILGELNGKIKLRTAFKMLDHKERGFIDQMGLKKLLERYVISVSKSELGLLMRKYDPENKGYLEYVSFIQKLLTPDYPSQDYEVKSYKQNKINNQMHALAKHLARKDRQQSGSLSEFLEPKVIIDGCMQIGILLSDEHLADLLERCNMVDGKTDYLEFLTRLKQALSPKAKKGGLSFASNHTIPKHPYGMMQKLIHPDPTTRPKYEAKPAVAHPMTEKQIEALLREKITLRCRGGMNQLRDAFYHFNRDGTGFITYTEFANALAGFNIQLAPKDVDRMFDKYDRDGDGVISYLEFVNNVMPADTDDKRPDSLMYKLQHDFKTAGPDLAGLRNHFKRADELQNGTVNWEQLRRVCDVCRINVDEDELLDLMKECERSEGLADIDAMMIALRRRHLKKSNQTPFNDPRRNIYSPTPRVKYSKTEKKELPPESRVPAAIRLPDGSETYSVENKTASLWSEEEY